MYKIKRTFPGNTHYILQSYLTDRKFWIKYNEHTRDYDIMSGVPQGSVLGATLTLFLLQTYLQMLKF